MSAPNTCRGITAGVYVIAVLPKEDVLRQPEDGVVLIVLSIYAPCMHAYNKSALQGMQAWYAQIRPSGDKANDQAPWISFNTFCNTGRRV